MVADLVSGSPATNKACNGVPLGARAAASKPVR